MLSRLIDLDYLLFYYVHFEWSNNLGDSLFPFIRNQFFWAPIYLFLLIYSIYNYGKKGLLWCISYLVTFGIADYTSSSILKPIFERMRPCNDETFLETIRELVNCGSGYSFPSSHAANHFAMSVFIAITLTKNHKWLWAPLLLWAALVAYAQVYVGVHFPMDVLAGALIGSFIGVAVGILFNKYVKLQSDIPHS
jgi:membrane-associated phospholipid phosphatase